MEETQYQELSKKIDMLIKLSAADFVHRKADKEESMVSLSRMGFSSSEIAELVGSTPSGVRVTLHRHKKKKTTKRQKK